MNQAAAGGTSANASPRMPALGPVPMALLKKMARLDAAIEPAVFGAPVQYSLEQVAELAGAEVEQVRNLARWIGRPPRDIYEVRYTDSDVDSVRQILAYAEAKALTQQDLGALIRGMALSMEGLTSRQVEAIVQRLADRQGLGDTGARLIGAELIPQQTAELLPLLDHIYRRHFASSIRRLTTDAIAQRGLGSSDTDYPLVRAIGFADLVNFTARTEKATPEEFRELIRHFRDTSWDIVNENGGRIVNFIGDAVFFTADTVHEGANIALQLAAPGALGICGEARASLAWAKVLSTHGDIYGAGVNLASRLCTVAEPSEVIIGPRAASLLSRLPEFTVTPQPAFEARGIGLVRPALLRYTSDTRPAPVPGSSRALLDEAVARRSVPVGEAG